MSTDNPLLSLFKEQLEKESKKIAIDNKLDKRGDFLIWWYFIKLRGLDDSKVETIVCDDSNDLGVDAIEIDDDNFVHFYQFKNPNKIDAIFPGGDVDKIISGLNLVLSRKYKDVANENLKDRLKEVNQSVREGYRLHLVTSGSGFSKESTVKLDNFVSSLLGPSESFFRWEIEDLKYLQDAFYRKNLPTVEDPIRFRISQTPYQVRSSNHDCYMFHTEGGILAELYKKYGEQLLQQNIRVYQNEKSTNSFIKQTCTGKDSGNFFHFNNGVTFLCETASWDQFSLQITLDRAQIVNGGQTTRVLSEAYENGTLKSDVLVPIRLITSQGDKEFSNNVTVNLNNQNRMKSSFLRSNDPRIIQLASALVSLGWYLERRENEISYLSIDERNSIELKIGRELKNRIIPLEAGSRAYVSTYRSNPELAKKLSQQMFISTKDGGRFEEIFNDDLSAEKFVCAYQIKKSIDEFIKQFRQLKRKRANKLKQFDWKNEYLNFLGQAISAKEANLIDQIIPNGSEFLSALFFEIQVNQLSTPVEDLVNIVKDDNALIVQTIFVIVHCVKNDPNSAVSKRWSALLQSQTFFETVTSYYEALNN